MSSPRMVYFEKDDVLHLAISDDPEAGSVEISPNITAEINARGELIGIEILNASRFVRDSVLESVQAKMLNLTEVKQAWLAREERADFGGSRHASPGRARARRSRR